MKSYWLTMHAEPEDRARFEVAASSSGTIEAKLSFGRGSFDAGSGTSFYFDHPDQLIQLSAAAADAAARFQRALVVKDNAAKLQAEIAAINAEGGPKP